MQTYDRYAIDYVLFRDIKEGWHKSCPYNYDEDDHVELSARFMKLTPHKSAKSQDTCDQYMLDAMDSDDYLQLQYLIWKENERHARVPLQRISSSAMLSSSEGNESMSKTSSMCRISLPDALIRQLRRAPTASDELNLLVTALIAEIARYSEPGVDEYLGIGILEEEEEEDTETETEDERIGKMLEHELCFQERISWEVKTAVPSTDRTLEDVRAIATGRSCVYFALRQAVVQEAVLAAEALEFLRLHHQQKQREKVSRMNNTVPIKRRRSKLEPVAENPTTGSPIFVASPDGQPDADQVIRTHQLLREFCQEVASVVYVKGSRRAQEKVEKEQEKQRHKWESSYNHDEDEEQDWLWGWCGDSGSEDEQQKKGQEFLMTDTEDEVEKSPAETYDDDLLLWQRVASQWDSAWDEQISFLQ